MFFVLYFIQHCPPFRFPCVNGIEPSQPVNFTHCIVKEDASPLQRKRSKRRLVVLKFSGYCSTGSLMVHDIDNELRLQKNSNLLNLKPVLYPLGASLCNVFVHKRTEPGLHCASRYYVLTTGTVAVYCTPYIHLTILRRNNIKIEHAP
jgi:hypothetical protein